MSWFGYLIIALGVAAGYLCARTYIELYSAGKIKVPDNAPEIVAGLLFRTAIAAIVVGLIWNWVAGWGANSHSTQRAPTTTVTRANPNPVNECESIGNGWQVDCVLTGGGDHYDPDDPNSLINGVKIFRLFDQEALAKSKWLYVKWACPKGYVGPCEEQQLNETLKRSPRNCATRDGLDPIDFKPYPCVVPSGDGEYDPTDERARFSDARLSWMLLQCAKPTDFQRSTRITSMTDWHIQTWINRNMASIIRTKWKLLPQCTSEGRIYFNGTVDDLFRMGNDGSAVRLKFSILP